MFFMLKCRQVIITVKNSFWIWQLRLTEFKSFTDSKKGINFFPYPARTCKKRMGRKIKKLRHPPGSTHNSLIWEKKVAHWKNRFIEILYSTAHLDFLFLSPLVYLLKNCSSQFFSNWKSAEPVFCSEELSCLPYKNQNKSLF